MIREGLTFDDVMLIPQHSKVKSRSTIDTSVNLGRYKYRHPIIPANMQTITGLSMAWSVVASGGLAILHRFMPIEEQINIVEDITDQINNHNIAVSVGVKPNDREYVSRFAEVDVNIFCIDIAHGDSEHCLEMVRWIKSQLPNSMVIAGNVCTGEGARRLWQAGADVVKAGVGSGSLCTTRIETGNGVPQLTALMDIADAQRQIRELEQTKLGSKRTFPFISDGGVKCIGDIVKSLCFADMVMTGNMFAGCLETPAPVREIGGISYKEYVGSSTHKTNHVEGVSALVPCKGTYDSILTKMLEGLKSGCSYQGAENLTELKDNPAFIRITNSGLIESHPHNVIIK